MTAALSPSRKATGASLTEMLRSDPRAFGRRPKAHSLRAKYVPRRTRRRGTWISLASRRARRELCEAFLTVSAGLQAAGDPLFKALEIAVEDALVFRVGQAQRQQVPRLGLGVPHREI